jgi:hypothetical protein
MEIAGRRCFAVKSAIRLAREESKSGDDAGQGLVIFL